MAIESFRKDSPYFFLSNMYKVGGGIQTPEGILAPSAENIYQSRKFFYPDARSEVLKAEDGYKAKKVADRLIRSDEPLRGNWDEIKVDVMRDVQALKFAAGTKMARMLLNTAEEELIQGNNHDDTFWGVCPVGSQNGENWLGRILMEQRQALREDVAIKS